MSKDKIKLDAGLKLILSCSKFDHFTVLELRDTYVKRSDDNAMSKVEARRMVYRNILGLLKKGFLRRIEAENKRKTRYQKTEKFHKANTANNDHYSSVDKATALSKGANSLLKELTEKLQRYKLEMLSRVGESEEYKSLYSEFPQMKEMLQERYNKARDESSKLLGRVKALEVLIEQQRIQTQ